MASMTMDVDGLAAARAGTIHFPLRRWLFLCLFLAVWLSIMSVFANSDWAIAYARRAEIELKPVLENERSGWQVDNLSLFRNSLDATGASRWRENQLDYFSLFMSWSALPLPTFQQDVTSVRVAGNRVRVEVRLTFDEPITTSQEVRYYRQVGGAWRRTDGHFATRAPLLVQTPHLTIRAYDIDDKTAQLTVQGVEDYLERARRDLSEATESDLRPPLELEINPPPLAPLFGYDARQIGSDSDTVRILRAPLAFALARNALDGGMQRLELIYGKSLEVLADGLVSWEARTYAPPPRRWAEAERTLMRDALKNGYAIPLQHMTRGILPVGGTNDAGALINYQAWSIADYIALRYGRERFGQVADGVIQYSQWETLTRAVFDTSVEEFERSWREHLEELLK